jgi:hypothetical protein
VTNPVIILSFYCMKVIRFLSYVILCL